MRAQIRGLNRAYRNAQDATSMVQYTDGSLDRINSMLMRMRELVVDAASDTHTLQTRQMIQLELNQLSQEINDISARSQFNSTGLLNGSHMLPVRDVSQFIPGQLPSFYNAASLLAFQHAQASTAVPTDAVRIDFGFLYDGQTGVGWNFNNGVLNITGNGDFHIRGRGMPTDNRIVVNAGLNSTLHMENVNILSTGSGAAIDTQGANVALRLLGRNIIETLEAGYAGIQMTGGNLTIEGPGILEVTGGYDAAGIGGGAGMDGGDAASPVFQGISILGGTVTATGRGGGAGIGGGIGGASSVFIRNAVVTAIAEGSGAGIGGGRYGSGGDIVIAGGIVDARGGTLLGAGIGAGAGIGGGYQGDGGLISITRGITTATGGDGAAGIGGGFQGNGGFIDVAGGIVRATGGALGRFRGAAVGGGIDGQGADLVMLGGLLEIAAGQRIGGGDGVNANTGTTTVQGGNLSIDPASIRGTIWHHPYSLAPLPAFRAEIFLRDLDGYGINFTPETTVFYNLDGQRINAIIDSDGRLFMYLPLNAGEIDMIFNGHRFRAEINMNPNHGNQITLRQVRPNHVPVPEMPGNMWHFQVGANSGNSMFLYIPTVNAQTLGIVDGVGNSTINVIRQSGAAISRELGIIDRAMEIVSGERARMGAVNSRLNYVMNQLAVTEENMVETESRIRSADMAAELSSLVRAQLLQQSTINVLAITNRAPERALLLLELDNASVSPFGAD